MTTKSTQWGMKQGDNFRSFTAQSNGRMVHGLEAGEGPLVIALHGFPDLPISFRHQIPLLAENGCRVIAPCLRGYSESDAPSDGPFEVAILIQDLLALIDQLSDQPVTLLGHDWGAAVVRGAAMAELPGSRRRRRKGCPSFLLWRERQSGGPLRP